GGVENLKNRIFYLQKTSTGGANFQKVSTEWQKFKKLGVCVTNNVLKSHILWDAQGSWRGRSPCSLPPVDPRLFMLQHILVKICKLRLCKFCSILLVIYMGVTRREDREAWSSARK